MFFRAALLATCTLALTALPGCGSNQGGDIGVADEELSGSPDAINIGFNGDASQFTYFETFLSAGVKAPGPRICHTYTSWNVANMKPGSGSATDWGTRKFLENWLATANGKCDEALISFKAYAGLGDSAKLPTAEEFATAFDVFVNTDWGFKGTFSFTAWNEPNNGSGSGNGLTEAIPADTAAEFYLKLRRRCEGFCKIAAGDLASNGAVGDFQWNCPDDDVAPDKLCKEASYLDRYKNYIANHATDADDSAPTKLKEGFRPEYFAYHGWADINNYDNHGIRCDDSTCVTNALLKNLGGSWGGVTIWDTEVGSSQDGQPVLSDPQQACGAAFILHLTSVMSRRITRVYYTRMRGGSPELFDSLGPRPSLKVLQNRETTYGGAKCS